VNNKLTNQKNNWVYTAYGPIRIAHYIICIASCMSDIRRWKPQWRRH